MDPLKWVFPAIVVLLIFIALMMVRAGTADGATTGKAVVPLQQCEGHMKFERQDDGVLKLNCSVRRSEWLLFTGVSTGEGYRLKWTARTDDYPYTGVVAANGIFSSAVIPRKARVATASMAKDPLWVLELRAEPRGLADDSTMKLVVHLGSHEDGVRIMRKVRISS